MARKKSRKRRVYRYIRRRVRRRKSKTMPILPIIGLGATQFSNLGEGSISQKGPLGGFLEHKNVQWLLRDELLTFTGFDNSTGNWDIMRAKGLQTMILTTLVSRLVGKYVNPTLRSVPLIGKKLRL